jgi:hypothetical protein
MQNGVILSGLGLSELYDSYPFGRGQLIYSGCAYVTSTRFRGREVEWCELDQQLEWADSVELC